MVVMQSQSSEVSAGAERVRRYRERKRQGVVCVARVSIYVRDTDVLVESNRLDAGDVNDATKITEAVEALVDDFTEGKLVPAGDE